jgi:hypothetical protein
MIRAVLWNGRGAVVAGVIVAANFAFALQLTGLSYGRYDWTTFSASYEVATATPTSTPTATPTATPTPIPNGGSCADGSMCASTFCVDGVCCDRACDQPSEQCNVAGQAGTCVVPAAPAPALGPGGLLAAVLVLLASGALAVRARRRRHGTS